MSRHGFYLNTHFFDYIFIKAYSKVMEVRASHLYAYKRWYNPFHTTPLAYPQSNTENQDRAFSPITPAFIFVCLIDQLGDLGNVSTI